MELKKKLSSPQRDDMHKDIPTEFSDECAVQESHFPPRKRVHHTASGKSIVKKSVLVIPIALILGVGSCWVFTHLSGSIKNQGIGQIPKKEESSTTLENTKETTGESVSENKNDTVSPTELSQENPKQADPEAQDASLALETAANNNVVQLGDGNDTIEKKKREEQQIIRHLVQPGETLYHISVQYYGSGRYSQYLAKRNHIDRPTDLLAGRTIKVPVPPERD